MRKSPKHKSQHILALILALLVSHLKTSSAFVSFSGKYGAKKMMFEGQNSPSSAVAVHKYSFVTSCISLASSSKDDSGNDDNNALSYNYNDDAFGLVFLTGALVDKDYEFSGIFMVLSAVAAAVSRNLPGDELVSPGKVALVALFLRFAYARFDFSLVSKAEIGVCLISFFWDLFKESQVLEE